MYHKILVPVDGSSHSRFTLAHAIGLAGDLGKTASITVIHVGSYATVADMATMVDLNRLLEDEGKAILESAEAAFRGVDVIHDSRYLSGDPAETICRLVRDEGFDLVVIGNRGGGLFTELLMGSVSHKVIQHVACPVLVVRQTPEA